MRLLKFVIIPLLMHTPLRGQCEGDLSWEYGEKKEEGFSIGQMFSNAFTPQLVIDTKEIRSYVRDARYKELTKRCGDLRAVDAIYIRSLKIAGYSIGRALLLSMMAVLEHQNLHVRIPIVSSIKLPLTLEEDSLFLQRIRHLPGRVYADSPTNGEMDKDKLQHFFASAYIAYFSGDVQRGIIEADRGRKAALDPFYRGFMEAYLGLFLASTDGYENARSVIEPALRFAEDRQITMTAHVLQVSQALVLLGEGELSRGMDQLTLVKQSAGELGAVAGYWAAVNEAIVYARIATGEAKASTGAMIRNPGFVLGRARKASQTALDALVRLSEHLSPDLELLRFTIEFELGKLLIKRKESDAARSHLEKAIAFLQPLGDCKGMRDAQALLAALNR